ncbi:hypothetical protein PP740_gp067 [Stenotrophomonas phage Philippe]|uniref:Uncharacterized protein n=1 Tax=Stenotrophomonas phage Philippe TaxID=2859655 RepID=A0AAE8BI48_9CAUD|nr:hypothetical protein PP740_gp067 [Stenotrophomonas phage Philippe]QYW02275.1 hypothetical protein CPT_Philippe_082 [Stenotrophomonas phage Philippe]
MSDQPETVLDDENERDDVQDEKEVLRARLKQMGVTYSNNAGVEALRQKLQDAINGNKSNDEEEPAPVNTEQAPAEVTSLPVGEASKVAGTSYTSIRNKVRAEALKLVRVRISCMDPKKANWPGEIFTVSNEYIGTVRRFVPFGEATDDGWHIEQCILDMLQERKFQQVSAKRKKGQIDVQYDRYIREFSIEILPPLTEKQLNDLAKAQLAAGTSGFHS